MIKGLLLAIISVFTPYLWANNIQINNTSVLIGAPSATSALITFDISWENSWRLTSAPHNWDAAWVFVKFKDSDGNWQHATLTGTETVPASATVDIKENAGAMIYRSTDGTGAFDLFDLSLIWDYVTDGVPIPSSPEIKIFAIEMVYVPQGQFYLGNDKGSFGGSDEETRGFSRNSAGNAYLVTSDGAITVNAGGGTLIASSQTTDSGNIPASWPVGFDAFYCMKYEVTQALWVDFFNTLTDPQKANRDITDATGKNSDTEVNRNGVSYTSGQATTTLPHVAMNFTSQNDALALLDWAALRPMTETEYEKAVRGPETPSPSIYAWGTTDIKSGTNYSVTDEGLADEAVTPATFAAAGNAVFGGAIDNPNSFTDPDGPTYLSGKPGPFRVGIFGGSANVTTRLSSGATYYGIMEMSGNVAEGVISIGTQDARDYTGNHGDGKLVAGGSQNEGWPTGESIGWRGGWFSGDISYMMIADRSLMGKNPNNDTRDNNTVSISADARLNYYQIRGLRH